MKTVVLSEEEKEEGCEGQAEVSGAEPFITKGMSCF